MFKWYDGERKVPQGEDTVRVAGEVHDYEELASEEYRSLFARIRDFAGRRLMAWRRRL